MVNMSAGLPSKHSDNVAQPVREFCRRQHADSLNQGLGQDASECCNFPDSRRDLSARGTASAHRDVNFGTATQEQFLIHP
ncbi:hypothetical protein PGR6_46670 [Pseudomonas sp. GR 6-02]|nr:hypothetical protein PGR6_46670 [Pseudomonas sp. GR 6-02]